MSEVRHRGLIAIAAAAAVVFLLLHLPYLPASLEDLDSINFALGMRQFDVAHHQPHPPGYPLFILVAKGVRAVVADEAKALGGVSAVAGAIGIVAMAVLFGRLRRPDDNGLVPLLATLFAATTPLYWFTAARPLSDSLGLAAAIGVQALALSVRSDRALIVAAFCAGLATGVRSQIAWLTLPLLTVCGGGRSGARPAALKGPFHDIVAVVGGFIAGVLVWFVPLVVISGGPATYWHALFDQGAEDLSNIQMLWTSPTPRALLNALYYAFIAPWAVWWLAAAVLACAIAGVAALAKRDRRALLLTAVAFGPYFVFDLLFQETFTSRYALPLVVPLAWLAANGLRTASQPLAIAAAVPIVMYGAHIGGRSIAAYSREPAPAFRLLADMREAAAAARLKPVLAPDRRQSFDLRRPLKWLGDEAPAFDRQLSAPPQHEWLEAVKYWSEGGRAPVWFVVDPRRAAIDLVQHKQPASYAYRVPYPVLLSGTRPSDANWYRVDRPEWFAGEGWALTAEAAGVAAVDGKGLSSGPIQGWARRSAINNGAFVLGGRNFNTSLPPQLTAMVGSRSVVTEALASGPFLYVMRLPGDLSTVATEYDRVEIRADPAANIAVEQFDLSTLHAVFGYAKGWHEREFNPSTGRQWRWLSDRGELRYLTVGVPVKLRISGEGSRHYYSRASRLVVRAGDRTLADTPVADDFTIDIDVPPAVEPSTLVVETDQTHVPAETSWRGSGDRRRLGLRIYSCELVPRASVRDTTANFPPAR